MQLSRLYSNKESKFSPINFNCGDSSNLLNVIFAKVTKPKDRTRDSHNLGKTTLIHLLDFLLLKDISGGFHFLSKHSDKFFDFVFYLEYFLQNKKYVTVRRSVANPTQISLKIFEKGRQNFQTLPEEEWDHFQIPLSKACQILDSYFDLREIAPWDYRNGVSYFLRTQEDYIDFFQIQKFVKGKDRDWKPYLANIFGLNYQIVHKKYELDLEIKELENKYEEMLSSVPKKLQDRNDLATKVEIKRDEISEISNRLDSFDFSEEERRISKTIVNEIEKEISELNNTIYNFEADIFQIEKAISKGFKFKIDEIKAIFEESKVTLPDALVKNYEELTDFNRQITKERNLALRQRKIVLKEELIEFSEKHSELDQKRSGLLKIIRDADTFRKYKALQNTLSEQRGNLSYLEDQLEFIDSLTETETKISTLKQERTQIVSEIKADLRKENPIKTLIILLFNRYVKEVLNVNGNFSISQYKNGNIFFKILITDSKGEPTSQSVGNTYRKLLCALFDLAVLKAYENKQFYHFVYHDGIFEGLDDRIKLNLLEFLRKILEPAKIQYILSTIEDDIPLDDKGQKFQFNDNEIILNLFDSGDEGQLFKMPPF